NAEDASNRRIIELVARGEARSRSALAAQLGVAPSTMGARVQNLVDAGILREAGAGTSRGGRRPRMLQLAEAGTILTADLGGGHASIGRDTLGGALGQVDTIDVDLTEGPQVTLARISKVLDRFGKDSSVRAIGIGLPGPVDV